MRFERRGGFGGRRFGGSRRGGFKESGPVPIKVGEEYDVEISETGSRGDGIARIKNFVVFVNGTKQGEKAHIKITEVRSRFGIGQKTEGVAAETQSKEPENLPQKDAEKTDEANEEEDEKMAEEEFEEEETEEE